jgi:hypothetical protein
MNKRWLTSIMSYIVILMSFQTIYSINYVQTRPTCWSNIIRHCSWTRLNTMLDNVAWCWEMMEQVWLCLKFSSNIVQHHPILILDSFDQGSTDTCGNIAYTENVAQTYTFNISCLYFAWTSFWPTPLTSNKTNCNLKTNARKSGRTSSKVLTLLYAKNNYYYFAKCSKRIHA